MKRVIIVLLVILLPLSWVALNNNSFAQSKSGPPVIGTNIGDKAPEIALPDVNGKILKLSSLKGYVVMIDFWASWCGPCRRENPNVVEAWNKYKDKKFTGAKGFKIFSVSLDKQKEPWINAIKADKLEWTDHVSDLKGWQSEGSGAYGVNSIPANFIIDANGIIISKNLRGIDLHYQLEKLVKN